MRRLLTLSAIALIGCATTAGYEQMLNSWVGAPEVELVRKWGPPANTYETAGSKFIVYRHGRNMFMPGTPGTTTTQFVGNTAYTTTSPGIAPMNLSFSCETNFEIREGRVFSWRYNGNDCLAEPR